MPTDFSIENFDPLPNPDQVLDYAHELLEVAVGRSKQADGFWVVSGRSQCLQVLQDPVSFAVGGPNQAVRIPADPPDFNRPLMPPQDVNPPVHRDFRALINPFLSPKALEPHEASFRETISGLVGAFAPARCADIVSELGSVFPAMITFRDLFGIDDEVQLKQVHGWVSGIVYGRSDRGGQHLSELQDLWNSWTTGLIDYRRHHRRNDVLDSLLFGSVEDGRPLTHDEVLGALQVLTLGGFMTTSDATCNLVIALIENPTLEHRLRAEPHLIARFVEEVLRLEPPVATRPRRCIADFELDGHTIPAGERVMVNLVSANRDPQTFDHPDDLDLERPHNRHLAFGGGIHRCVGSTLARITLRMVVEELLDRVTALRFADEDGARRKCVSGATWRLVESLPVTFEPRGA